eukprot:26016_1
MALGWAAITSIIYFWLYFLLLMSLAYYVHSQGDYENKKSFLLALWKRRGIYGQVLIHLYDTATDCGVLVEWYLLGQEEKKGHNVESLDLSALFWTSIAFIIVYRMISTVIGCMSAYSVGEFGDSGSRMKMMCFDGFLGLIDMYVIKAVYVAIKEEEEEPTTKQKMIQLGEAVVESLPQIVLQSVYIIRGQNDPDIRERSSLYLVGLSLMASLLSITNKYVWIDGECVQEQAKEAKLAARLPICCQRKEINENKTSTKNDKTDTKLKIQNTPKSCINKCLVWSVVGGAWLGIFMAASFFIWFAFTFSALLSDIDSGNYCGWQTYSYAGAILVAIGFGVASIGASPAYQSHKWMIGHAIEVVIAMIIITVFAFHPSIDCSICANPADRQALDNAYILAFIITGWIAMLIDFCTFFIMLQYDMFNDEVLSAFDVVDDGI